MTSWDWRKTNLKVADVNNNGTDDVVLSYDYNGKIGIWNFISSGTTFSSKNKVYTAGSFYFNRSKFQTGDVTGSGRYHGSPRRSFR